MPPSWAGWAWAGCHGRWSLEAQSWEVGWGPAVKACLALENSSWQTQAWLSVSLLGSLGPQDSHLPGPGFNSEGTKCQQTQLGLDRAGTSVGATSQTGGERDYAPPGKGTAGSPVACGSGRRTASLPGAMFSWELRTCGLVPL